MLAWRKMGEWKEELIHNAEKFDFPIFTPYYELTDAQRRLLWEGNQYFHGINDFFKMLEENQYKIQYRVMLARYRGKTLCPKCHGTRLKPEAGYVRVGGKNISELVDLPITELKQFFDHLELDEHDSNVSRRILIEINSRIRFLIDVGLGYLTLNRLSNSLSGGKASVSIWQPRWEVALWAVFIFSTSQASDCIAVIQTACSMCCVNCNN